MCFQMLFLDRPSAPERFCIFSCRSGCRPPTAAHRRSESGSIVGSGDPGASLDGGEGVSNREILEAHKGGQEGKRRDLKKINGPEKRREEEGLK